MVGGLIGKKLGMTQVFEEDGKAVPVTVLQVGPCVVVHKKPAVEDRQGRVQLGFVEPRRKPRVNQPLAGHFRRAGVPPTSVLKEFTFREDEDNEISVGDQFLVKDVFEVDEYVHVGGKVKGRGFQGVIRRHGFSGGRATHGSMFHRAPGSIGASASPSRVLPGIKNPGRMGNNHVKVQNLRVVEIDEDNNLLLVKGSVPGSRGGYVIITRAE
jgi:large subunit ribosomal protein L3